MRIGFVSMALLCATVFAAAPAEAQTCLGAPSFREQPYQVGVDAGFTDGAQAFGGHFAAGGEALFAGAGVGLVNYSDLDSTATEASGFAGADLAVSETDRVYVCPIAQIGFASGPDIGAIDVSSFSLQAGGSVGVIASQTDMLMVIPTFGLAAVYNRVTAERPSGADLTESDSAGIASVGVGFVFNQNIGIIPSLSIPFSAGDSDPIFNIRFAFNFGR